MNPSWIEPDLKAQNGLGRIYIPDPKDAKYRIRDIVPRSALLSRNWRSRHWLMGRGTQLKSQGYTPHCVRYACAHVMQLAPVVRTDAFPLTSELYPWAQQNDEWPGEAYDGTSVRAGLDYLRLVLKVISGYRWARTMDEVIGYLSLSPAEGGGPLVVGTDWWTGMDDRDDDGNWHPSGRLRGGHAYVLGGHTMPKIGRREGRIRALNSHEGNFRGWLSYDEVEYLLFQANGECAAVQELKK